MDNQYCRASGCECVKTRRCFITGEYCSKQTDIYKTKNKLRRGKTINAFVVMNFSDMSDVAYEKRLKPYVEKLKEHFYLSDSKNEIICVNDPNKLPFNLNREKNGVDKINVIRSDSSFVSNFVICNRVCQQMQIADLIVVDVSVKNANVFYELGMAIAMGKLILPVCYSDSYFYIDQEIAKMELTQFSQENERIYRHISSYTWRRQLFEYYGLRYKNSKEDDTAYLTVDRKGKWYPKLNKKNRKFAHSCSRRDPLVSKYFTFPYHDRRVGYDIYNLLCKSYNQADEGDNTLVLYTLERILNYDQAGQCIINYYNYITQQMKEMECFCGDRVGTLAQTNYVSEQDKDDVQGIQRQFPYGISEIIHIGVNQATYATYQDSIMPSDYLAVGNEEKSSDKKCRENDAAKYVRFLKEYTANRSMLIYPENPVYVERYTTGLQPELLNNKNLERYFCLYHIMLRNLKYVREIVVDVSDTSLESMFWLGMAHGADIYAITVKRQITNREREKTGEDLERKERTIFDVAGLWCAGFRSDDIQGFYRQLQSVHYNIEQQSKLIMSDMDYWEMQMNALLYLDSGEKNGESQLKNIRNNFNQDAKYALESYYRSRFWRAVLKDNRVQVFVHEKDEQIKENEECDILGSRSNISRWDFEAVAILSRYLAQRTPVGVYEIKTCNDKSFVKANVRSNVISIGAESKPFKIKNGKGRLSEYIKKSDKGDNLYIRTFKKENEKSPKNEGCNGNEVEHRCIQNRGFCVEKNEACTAYWYTQVAHGRCEIDSKYNAGEQKLSVFYKENGILLEGNNDRVSNKCEIKNGSKHLQLGQLLLWRKENEDERYFYISLVGASGPATKALSSLLVSTPLKSTIFDEKEDKKVGEYCLSDLQFEVRKQFIEKFVRSFGTDYVPFSIINAVKLYLTTTLYRYFLPFLTVENERRILNGTAYFLRTLRISDELDSKEQKNLGLTKSGEINDDLINQIVSKLEVVLRQFKGVDALFQVTVKSNKSRGKDTRSIIKIEPMKASGEGDKNNKEWIRCLFTSESF